MMTLTTQERHDIHQELETLEESYTKNKRSGRHGTYQISHKLLGFLLLPFQTTKAIVHSGEPVTVRTKPAATPPPQSPTAIPKLGEMEIARPPKFVSSKKKPMPKRDPTTGRFLKKVSNKK